ncbi:MAG: DNA-processing protein DprA [Prevotella sp.]|jgi:predicted Rossmann fold nucleotide-binding protein DprA/Smf involved in DNA uptake|nr:DNA-processing protein DprA [Prevotella sp.]
MTVEYLGNQELLKLRKTAFLASSTISSETVLQVYDWATEMRNRGECVVSGFSSKLEQDVLHFLLKGSQPIILVLGRQMYRDIPSELKEALAQNRLLMISVSNATRQSKATAMARNRYVCEMADRILFVGVTEQSSLYAYKNKYQNKLEKSI